MVWTEGERKRGRPLTEVMEMVGGGEWGVR